MVTQVARIKSVQDDAPCIKDISLWHASQGEVWLGIFAYDRVTPAGATELTGFGSAILEIWSDENSTSELLVADTITSASFNTSLTLAEWDAKEDATIKFSLTDAELTQGIQGTSTRFWYVVYLLSGAGRSIIAGGRLSLQSNQGDVGGVPPPPLELYYTRPEVDALIAAGGGGGGSTNLTFSRTSTTVTVLSNTGTDAILPAADATNAGVMSSADKVKLDGISGTGTTNLTFSRTSTTVTVLSDTGADATVPAADASNAGVMLSADKIKLDALPTNATLTQSLAGKASLAHQHTFSEVLDLPAITPRDVASLVLPVGSAGSALTHSIPVSTAYYLFQVRPSAQNYVLGLLLEGVTPNSAQLAAIDQFFAYSDSTGFVAGQPAGARLVLSVWNNNSANVLNLLAPATVSTKVRLVNPTGFVTAVGSIKTDMAAATKGFIAMDTTSAAAWATDDWSYGYYSHLAAVLTDNAMIGGRNDTISGSTNRYICTTTATVARWSPGYTPGQGNIDAAMTTSNPLGLIWIGYKGTKLDARQIKAAGSTTLFDTTGTYTATLTAVPFLGLAYNQEAGVSSLSGQPASLLFVGKKIANDATASTTLATALYNLAIGTGATAV
jgi:hypothetical protein